MLLKYRVCEFAKDIGIDSKIIIKLLKEKFNNDRKSMSILSIEELNFIFDYYTQKYQVKSFDDYFLTRKKKLFNSNENKNIDEILNAYKSKNSDDLVENSSKIKKNIDKSKKNIDSNFVTTSTFLGETKFIQEYEIGNNEKNTKIVNMKNENMNIDKYNEKYDLIANVEKAVDKRLENSVSKQKFHQKIYQYRKSTKKRETESERLARITRERKSKPLNISIPDKITVGELAVGLKASVSEVIKKLIGMGLMLNVNDIIDFDTASLVAFEFHAKVSKEVTKTIEEMIINYVDDSPEDLKTRPPIVVVMGHVDHGKTSILDKIRNITTSEHGGITQHIGAYKVCVLGKKITFLDTPGHEAFTSLRARGAEITDIAILVVAADDGVMPQTIEAINHAKEANVSIIVAVNKIDKPDVNVDKIKQKLSEYGLVPEDWGGDVPFMNVSAKTGEGINDMLDMLVLMSDIKELKANPNKLASGVVIEAKLDKNLGVVVTVIVTSGTLNCFDLVVAGTSIGRVRTMTSDSGKRVKSALPSDPVKITGLDVVPGGGDKFNVVSDERLARQLIEQRKNSMNNERLSINKKITFENFFNQIEKSNIREFKIILKTDVIGSLEALKKSIESISIEDECIKPKVIHSAIGAIKESDVNLASASNAIIIGFNVVPGNGVSDFATRNNVEIKLYRIIYDCINDINTLLTGMIVPKIKEVEIGVAQCRKVYKITGVGMVAGCYVTTGKIERGSLVQVIRDFNVVAEDKIESLRRYKDDIKEAFTGYECGIKLSNFSDIKILDEIRTFKNEKI